MSDVMTVDDLMAAIQLEINSCNATIKKFQERFENNPRYALEWADEVYLAVSKIEDLKKLQDMMVGFQKNYNVENIVERFLRLLDQYFVNKLQRSGMSSSTSLSHRSVGIADTETAGLWFDDYNFRVETLKRSNIKAILDEAIKNIAV